MLKRFLNRRLTRRIYRLQQEVNRLRSALEAEERRHEVTRAECESLAAVVARDRERIKAESAAYGRARAESEGRPHEHTIESNL